MLSHGKLHWTFFSFLFHRGVLSNLLLYSTAAYNFEHEIKYVIYDLWVKGHLMGPLSSPTYEPNGPGKLIPNPIEVLTGANIGRSEVSVTKMDLARMEPECQACFLILSCAGEANLASRSEDRVVLAISTS